MGDPFAGRAVVLRTEPRQAVSQPWQASIPIAPYRARNGGFRYGAGSSAAPAARTIHNLAEVGTAARPISSPRILR